MGASSAYLLAKQRKASSATAAIPPPTMSVAGESLRGWSVVVVTTGDSDEGANVGTRGQEYGLQFPQLLLHFAWNLEVPHFLRILLFVFPFNFLSHQEGFLSLHVSDSVHNCTTKDFVPW